MAGKHVDNRTTTDCSGLKFFLELVMMFQVSTNSKLWFHRGWWVSCICCIPWRTAPDTMLQWMWMYICAIARYRSDLLYRWTERTLQLNCMYILHKTDVYCHLFGVLSIRRMRIWKATSVCPSLLPCISSHKNSLIHFGQLWCVVRQRFHLPDISP